MPETQSPKDADIIDASHRFGNGEYVKVHDESGGAEVIKIQTDDGEYEDAMRQGQQAASIPHIDKIFDYLASKSEQPRQNVSPLEQKRLRNLGKRVLPSILNVFTAPATMKTAADHDELEKKSIYSNTVRELPDRGRTQSFNKRHYSKHRTGPDQAS